MEVMAVGVEATDPPPEDWEVADDVWPNVTAYEFFTTDGDTLSTVTFARLAVTEDQIRDWQLPTRPTKSTDSSSAGFTARSVEVDAIRPRVLRSSSRTRSPATSTPKRPPPPGGRGAGTCRPRRAGRAVVGVSTYQQVHQLYRRRLVGVLPLPPGTSGHHRQGSRGGTGSTRPGRTATTSTSCPPSGTAQTALRMPSTVVGIDVDAYDGKTGALTFAEAGRRWGPLPIGPWSSARDDGVSGIRFLRVPDGTVLIGDIAFVELHIGHVEVIQRHHRYAVAWPSVHPATGIPYTWRGAAGPGRPPAVDDLPPLPDPWLAEASAGTGRRGERACPEQVAAFLAELPTGGACAGVRTALRDADAALRSPVRSRHDDTCAAVLRLLRLGERGHPGVAAALAALRGGVRPHRHLGRVAHRRVGRGGVRPDARRAERRRPHPRHPTPSERQGCWCRPSPITPTRPVLAGILRVVLHAHGAERARFRPRGRHRKLRGYVNAGQLPEDHATPGC